MLRFFMGILLLSLNGQVRANTYLKPDFASGWEQAECTDVLGTPEGSEQSRMCLLTADQLVGDQPISALSWTF